MFPFRSCDYSPAIAGILGNEPRVMLLAGGRCRSEAARALVERLDPVALFTPRRVMAPDFAAAARSGFFLYLSCLEESHEISQQITSTTGSYWHGMMHRQEPDFENAAYWFRRVRQHEIFPALREAAVECGYAAAPSWDPLAFIDACEQVHRRDEPQRRGVLERVQLAEWQLLFDFCCRRAVGEGA